MSLYGSIRLPLLARGHDGQINITLGEAFNGARTDGGSVAGQHVGAGKHVERVGEHAQVVSEKIPEFRGKDSMRHDTLLERGHVLNIPKHHHAPREVSQIGQGEMVL